MLHPHHDIIIAYLEGKTIEVYIEDKDTWEELGCVSSTLFMPLFHKHISYRVKPEVNVTELLISFSEEDNAHRSWTNTNYPNLRLHWLNNKLIKAEVINDQ
jgi:hypothetical protein